MNQSSIDHKIDEILDRENRYDRAAYGFVAQGVTFTVGRLPAHRHVSALELLYGLRDFARQEYGPMAPMVLEAWGLKYASDVGRIVYLLIDALTRQLITESREAKIPQSTEAFRNAADAFVDGQGQLANTLEKLNQALDSLRELADYLNQDPSSLLSGKKKPGVLKQP